MRSNIDGVVIKEIKKFTDDRGWLCEIFRKDELAEDIFPAMSYVSMTKPGVARGPHEHVRQIDLFCFLGTSEFSLMLWDNRKKSECYHEKEIIVCLQGTAVIAIIPPGVVHAYKNTGDNEGLVVNAPNKLYAGLNKEETVDEIRHEGIEGSPFIINNEIKK